MVVRRAEGLGWGGGVAVGLGGGGGVGDGGVGGGGGGQNKWGFQNFQEGKGQMLVRCHVTMARKTFLFGNHIKLNISNLKMSRHYIVFVNKENNISFQ